MAHALGFLVFLPTFLLVYGSIHYYVFIRFSKFFGIRKTLWFYAALVTSLFSFMLISIAYSYFGNFFVKMLYIIAASWMGFIFFLFSFTLLYDFLRLFKSFPINRAGIVLLCIGLAFSLFAVANATRLETKELELESSKIVSPLTIVQISDVHIGPIYGAHRLEKIVDRVNALNPDIVVITGDLIDGRYELSPDEFSSLGKLHGKVFFVMGNHERYAGIAAVEDLLRGKNITLLRNSVASIEVGSDRVDIIGLDDSDDRKYVTEELNKTGFNSSAYSILLYHKAFGYKDAAAAGVDLMLSGHTHRGQIFPFNLLVMMTENPVYGLRKTDDSYLYVSSGAGTWGPPMRLGSDSEIVRIRLLPARSI
ncbi:MAG: metallophosphoesterase [archaeon]